LPLPALYWMSIWSTGTQRRYNKIKNVVIRAD